MDFVIEFLTKNISSVGTYILFFLLGSAVLFHLSKLKNERQVALSTLQIIHTVLMSKLGEKADMLISIWIEGLKKIQDGEFCTFMLKLMRKLQKKYKTTHFKVDIVYYHNNDNNHLP